MGISLNVTIYLLTASVSLLSVKGNKGRLLNIPCDQTPVTQKAHDGGCVTIDCKYPRAEESNIRYFCRGDGKVRCTHLISSHTSKYTKKDRFSLTVDRQRGVYTATISTLTPGDAGIYWCTMKRFDARSIACLTEIHLEILTERHAKTKRPSPSSSQAKATAAPRFETTPPKCDDALKGLIAGVVVSLALSLTLVVVLILCRHKFTRTQGCCAAGGSSEQGTNAGHNTEGNHGDHDYEELQMRNQQASSGDVLPSIYAVVNPPADQLHYSSFNFQKDSVCVSTDGNALPDTNKNGSST